MNDLAPKPGLSYEVCSVTVEKLATFISSNLVLDICYYIPKCLLLHYDITGIWYMFGFFYPFEQMVRLASIMDVCSKHMTSRLPFL